MTDFAALLFQTGALKVCHPDNPFWYTSGMLGPYYVNTHFLYGNEQKAGNLLNVIDYLKSDKAACLRQLPDLLMENYYADNVFRQTIDGLICRLRDIVPDESYSYISGGERRDWIFSMPVAKLTGKPHLTLFKDNSLFSIPNSNSAPAVKPRQAVIHIADLLNTASSYERCWLPVLRQNGFHMDFSLVIADRNQGGAGYLNGENVKSLACVRIDKDFFHTAATKNLISSAQLQMINNYIDDPKQYMKSFLYEHPAYLNTAKDEKLSLSVYKSL